MPIMEDSIRIRGPREELFILSQHYGLRQEWDPFVRNMRFLGGATEAAVGMHVWVRAWTGLTMVARYTSYRSQVSVAMTMVRGPFFFRRFAGTWLFKPVDDDCNLVTFRYSFTTRAAFRLFDPVICWFMLRDIRARLHGLKWGAEEGGLLKRLRRPCA